MPQDFTWLNPPPRWSGDADTLELETGPNTDFWRETFSGADVTSNVWLLYSGVTLAPTSDIYGDGVNLASRVESLGGVFATDAVVVARRLRSTGSSQRTRG